ncbi:MAG TPA: C40 family peptidase [Saprospiraceae bacterium]|nr:C40 family peptidase [Saprospiraceae bacterium]
MIHVRTFCLLAAVLLLASCDTSRPVVTAKSSSKTYTNAVATPFRQKVVDYGKKFVGTTYKYAGQSPKTGFDCSGFTSYVMKENGVMVSPASAIQATEGRKVPLEKVMPGDLLFFGESKKKISHVGLVIKRGPEGITCVHSTTSRGVIVENVSQSTYWKDKILFARDVISED